MGICKKGFTPVIFHFNPVPFLLRTHSSVLARQNILVVIIKIIIMIIMEKTDNYVSKWNASFCEGLSKISCLDNVLYFI